MRARIKQLLEEEEFMESPDFFEDVFRPPGFEPIPETDPSYIYMKEKYENIKAERLRLEEELKAIDSALTMQSTSYPERRENQGMMIDSRVPHPAAIYEEGPNDADLLEYARMKKTKFFLNRGGMSQGVGEVQQSGEMPEGFNQMMDDQ